MKKRIAIRDMHGHVYNINMDETVSPTPLLQTISRPIGRKVTQLFFSAISQCKSSPPIPSEHIDKLADETLDHFRSYYS